jgi:hypothetical protein
MPGRHSASHAESTLVTAVGVKGSFMRRRPSFVAWALRMSEASRRTWSGFGEFGGVSCALVDAFVVRVLLKWMRRDSRPFTLERRAVVSGQGGSDAIFVCEEAVVVEYKTMFNLILCTSHVTSRYLFSLTDQPSHPSSTHRSKFQRKEDHLWLFLPSTSSNASIQTITLQYIVRTDQILT